MGETDTRCAIGIGIKRFAAKRDQGLQIWTLETNPRTFSLLIATIEVIEFLAHPKSKLDHWVFRPPKLIQP